MPDSPISLFFSYAHQDEALRDELAKHLSNMRRQGIIDTWHDRRILPGDEWNHQIDQNLNSAEIILLLISPDFIDSDYCWDVEVKAAMRRHECGEARVIPVILRPIDWKGALFGKLQVLPTNAEPVTVWPNQDAAFKDVTQGIREAIEELLEGRRQKQETKIEEDEVNLDLIFELALTSDEMLRGVEKSFFLNNDEVIYVDVPSGIKPGNCIPIYGKGKFSQRTDRRGDLYLRIIEIQKLESNKTFQDEYLRPKLNEKYSLLNKLLSSDNWMEADHETLDLMIKITGCKDWLSNESINSFPCEALRIIDNLWKNYSNGRFGFGIQRRIWLECGGAVDFEAEKRLGVRIGWLKEEIRHTPFGTLSDSRLINCSEINFSTNAPVGHLPAVWYIKHSALLDIKSFFLRVKKCGS